MEKLITEFAARGLKVAAIKHDGHDFTPDVKGTDSYRYQASGAYGTAVYSRNRVMMIKETANPELAEILDFYQEADLILIEGLKDTSLPKIELVRQGISDKPVSNPQGRILLISDIPGMERYGKTLDFAAVKETAKIIFPSK